MQHCEYTEFVADWYLYDKYPCNDVRRSKSQRADIRYPDRNATGVVSEASSVGFSSWVGDKQGLHTYHIVQSCSDVLLVYVQCVEYYAVVYRAGKLSEVSSRKHHSRGAHFVFRLRAPTVTIQGGSFQKL